MAISLALSLLVKFKAARGSDFNDDAVNTNFQVVLDLASLRAAQPASQPASQRKEKKKRRTRSPANLSNPRQPFVAYSYTVKPDQKFDQFDGCG